MHSPPLIYERASTWSSKVFPASALKRLQSPKRLRREYWKQSVEGFHSIAAKSLDIIRPAACSVNRGGIEDISRRIDLNRSFQTLPLHSVSSSTLCFSI